MAKSNYTINDLQTSWTFGNDAPKLSAITKGKAAEHQVFLEQVTPRGRRFGSYPTVEDMARAIGKDNHHLFEVLVEDRPVKLYLDLEWIGPQHELHDIINVLGKGFIDILNMPLSPTDIRLSCASGQGETGSYLGKMKRSYHLIVDNNHAFKTVQQARAFVNLAFLGDDRVDKSPYGRNQSFKLIWNSKLNSTRVQVPQDGHAYLQHMVSALGPKPTYYSTEKLAHALDRTTRLQVHVPCPVAGPTQPIYIADDVDIHSVSCLLKYFPNGPTKEHKQPFDVYMAVACICLNEDEPFETLREWASGYEKYNEDKTRRIWNSISKRLDGFDIRSLRNMLQKVNPAVLKNIEQKSVDSVMYPTIDYAAHNIAFEEYSEHQMLPFLEQARASKHLFIRGFMGLGKTYQILQLVVALKPTSVLIVTPRQLFARSMLGTFRGILPDLRLYKDTPKSERADHDYMICQLESLWTLNRTYEFLILDESESILHQFSSPTVAQFDFVCRDYKAIMLAAKHVIHTDAFLTDRTLLTAAHIDPTATKCFIWNHWVPKGRKAYCVGHYRTGKIGLQRAAHRLKDQNNVVVSASCHFAKELHSILAPSGPTAFIMASSSDEVKKELEDVNQYLQPFKHFMYTSAITVGTSYDRRDHFDNLIM